MIGSQLFMIRILLIWPLFFHWDGIKSQKVNLNKEASLSTVTMQIYILGQAGLEAAFQVPMPGDSGSSPDAGSISNYCLTQEIFTPTPAETPADCCPSISLK